MKKNKAAKVVRWNSTDGNLLFTRIVAPMFLIDFRHLSAYYNIHSGLLLYFVEVKDMEYMTVMELIRAEASNDM